MPHVMPWHELETAWDVWSEESVVVADNPRTLAQQAVDSKRLNYERFQDGSWAEDTVRRVVVMLPPGKDFAFALHQPTLQFFRSTTRGSFRMTPTSLRTVIAKERLWLQNVLKDKVPGGLELLALERGETEAVERAKARFAPPPPPQPTPVPTPVPTTPTLQAQLVAASARRPRMALLEVQSSTKRIIMEETTQTIDVDRTQLIGILRSAGAEVPRSATIRLLHGNGEALEIANGEKIRITWTELTEKEERS